MSDENSSLDIPRPRGTSERRAYLAGYAQALDIAEKHGVEFAREALTLAERVSAIERGEEAR